MKLGIKSVKIHIVGIFERKTRKLGRYQFKMMELVKMD